MEKKITEKKKKKKGILQILCVGVLENQLCSHLAEKEAPLINLPFGSSYEVETCQFYERYRKKGCNISQGN